MKSEESKKIVKALLKECKMTQTDLANQLRVKQTNITGILNRNNSMRVDNLVEMVEAMGYEVIVRDKRDHSIEWKVTDTDKSVEK